MVNPRFAQGRPTMFYCGDEQSSKDAVARIIAQCGWQPMDMGSAKAARAIEPLCQLLCIPGFRENRWTHAFSLLVE